MAATHSLIEHTAELIDYDSYVREPDGSMLPQSSARSSILHMLRLLEVEPGMRVLEVGTGSGYTSALLGRIVGDHGTVTSLDVAHILWPAPRASTPSTAHATWRYTLRTTSAAGTRV